MFVESYTYDAIYKYSDSRIDKFGTIAELRDTC